MIDPTDMASDDGWDEADEESSEAPTNGGQATAVAEAKDAETADDDTVGDAELDSDDELDSDLENEDAELSGEKDEDGARGKRRRRRKRRNDDYAAPDERAQVALDFVSKVVLEMEMDCRVRLRRPKNPEDTDEVNIEIVGRDAGRIIGKKGAVLQAIQFLTHRVINRPGLDRRHVLVDAEGYRSRRDNSLATMARRLGKQAVELGKIITFEPMNPRDRRVVHLALAKFEGVITKSDGEGDDRRVQIIPVRR